MATTDAGTEITFPVASFDGVVCLFALIHIPVDEQQPLLEKIVGWMRHGAALLISTGHTSWTGTESNWHGAPMWWSRDGGRALFTAIRNGA